MAKSTLPHPTQDEILNITHWVWLGIQNHIIPVKTSRLISDGDILFIKLWKIIQKKFKDDVKSQKIIYKIKRSKNDINIQIEFGLQLQRFLLDDASFYYELLKSMKAASNQNTKHNQLNKQNPSKNRQSQRNRKGKVNSQTTQVLDDNGKLNKVRDGAIALGSYAKSVAKDAVLIEHNISNLNINLNRKKIHKNKNALRDAYLNHIYVQTNSLALGLISHPGITEIRGTNLSDVYTELYVNAATITTPTKTQSFTSQQFDPNDTGKTLAIEKILTTKRLVLLGDPGSGKSALVNYVSLCMAGEMLGRNEANLKILSQVALDKSISTDIKKNRFKPLIPVRILLRELFAFFIDQGGKTWNASDIWRFIENKLNQYALDGFAKSLKKELRLSGGIIFFDGLDELPVSEEDLCEICKAIENFTSSFPQCRFVITSRIPTYQKYKLQGFTEVMLMPLDNKQISDYIDRWFICVDPAQIDNKLPPYKKSELFNKLITSTPHLLSLSQSPLLLTLILSLFTWTDEKLIEKREKLFSEVVNLLLDRWEGQRLILDAKTRNNINQPSLLEWLSLDRKKMRELLNRLAFEAHSHQQDLIGTGDIPESSLVLGLMSIKTNQDIKYERVIEYLRERAGLIIPRGESNYTFLLRVFQEYLAACYLADNNYPEFVAGLVRSDPDRWREVAILAGANASAGNRKYALWSLVDALIPDNDHFINNENWVGIQIACQSVIEILGNTEIERPNDHKINKLRTKLIELMESKNLSPVDKHRIGQNLSKLGDIRFNKDLWQLKSDESLGLIHIPAGKFVMGDKKQRKQSESHVNPEHTIRLPNYWISKYPITVAQFRVFTNSENYPFDLWELNPVETAPIVGVTWYDALEYTKWLDKNIKQHAIYEVSNGNKNLLWLSLVKGSYYVTLPSEAEWEKAARGLNGNIYPWGNKYLNDTANTLEANIGSPSVVGCFNQGDSYFSVSDMSGNVWEWTRSLWGHDWKMPSYKFPYSVNKTKRENIYASKDIFRIVRGGAFSASVKYARCAFRDAVLPDIRSDGFGFRIAISPIKIPR